MTVKRNGWLKWVLTTGVFIFMALIGVIYAGLKEDLAKKVDAAEYNQYKNTVDEKFNSITEQYIRTREAIQEVKDDLKAHDRRSRRHETP